MSLTGLMTGSEADFTWFLPVFGARPVTRGVRLGFNLNTILAETEHA